MCLHVQEIGQWPAFGELISATNDEVGRDTLPGHVDEIPELLDEPLWFLEGIDRGDAHQQYTVAHRSALKALRLDVELAPEVVGGPCGTARH
jgi:hypothetical protein